MRERTPVEQTVDYLVFKLDTKPESVDFLFWAAHRLPSHTLQRFAYTARKKGSNPGAYFNRLVKTELKRLGL